MGFTLFWQLVQVGVALVASNLITLRPLFHKLWSSGLLSSLRSRLFSSQDSNAHLRRGEADRSSNDYAPLNGSTQWFRKPGDAEQHVTVMPSQKLGENGNEIHVEPGQIRVQKDIVPTVEYV